ncbi:hypothetical protein [Streptantibioticus ferralitis]|uniref:Uncharacterized protein n=1 Tax=Streptantibioticus ferralitis TaxID=236510 RepID=A0ABT5Z6N2_9ACTN|nr:hypothetical protein [Streptantibioticus ferralitis]MDF2259493.1 hypothetical protein [Streptantibioticus ferralitis]
MSEDSTNEVHEAMSAALHSAIKVATEVAEMTAMRRMEHLREAQARSDAERNEFMSRLSAERDGALPTMRQPWDEAWWQQARPEEIARTWEVTQGWARAGDPYAQSTLEHMSRQLKERHGVEVPHNRDGRGDRTPTKAPGNGQDVDATRDARDRNLPGDRDEDRLRDKAHGEDAAALGSDETAMGLAETHAPAEDVHAEADHADDMRTAANQDRDAAAALATMEDVEAAEAVAVASEGFSGTPSARLAARRPATRSQSSARDALRSRMHGTSVGVGR